jgi:2-methylisocitrate lyase-like PEP mutase family enzyme
MIDNDIGEVTMISLRSSVQTRKIVVAPGCLDALSARLIKRAGFAAAYLSGASIAYTRFARPDIGLIDTLEMLGLGRRYEAEPGAAAPKPR